MGPLPGLTPIHSGRDHSGGAGKTLFTRQARLPAALSAAGWTTAPPPTEACPCPHPRDLRPETVAPLVEQGHLWLECDEGPDVGRSPEQVCEPEAVTVSAQEREEGSASTGAGRGLRGRGSGGQGAGPAAGKGKGAGSALPCLQKETPRP